MYDSFYKNLEAAVEQLQSNSNTVFRDIDRSTLEKMLSTEYKPDNQDKCHSVSAVFVDLRGIDDEF